MAVKSGPVLSFQDTAVAIVENSFRVVEADKSTAGYTVYKVQFEVNTETSEGLPILQECEIWKRFSDFQQLARQLEQIHVALSSQQKFPSLVKANYFDRFKESVIEERRVSSERLLVFASRNIHLVTCAPFISFIKGSAIVPRNEPPQSTYAQQSSTNHNTSELNTGHNDIEDEIDFDVNKMIEEQENTGTEGTEGGVSEESNDQELSDDNQMSLGGFIRSDSLMVSEWGLEHNLKLRDFKPLEEEEEEKEEINLEEQKRKDNVTGLSIPIFELGKPQDGEDVKEDDLPLPSTPNVFSKPSHEEDWWSHALAESSGIVDSLIDNIDSTSREPSSNKNYLMSDADKNSQDKRRSKSVSPQREHERARERRPSPTVSSNGAYIVHAGKLISQGLDFEKKGDLEEAFDLFKAGVDVLLSGVQTDSKTSRREAVRKKTAEYLQYTEQLQIKLFKRNQKAQLDKAKPSNAKPHLLQDFKMISVIASKVLLVESRHTSQRFVFKVLHKRLTTQQKTQMHGRMPRSKNRTPSQCPYMVKLLHHYETQSNRIFLLLEHVQGGQLLHHLQSIREQHLNVLKGTKQKKKKVKKQKEEQLQVEDSVTNSTARVVIGKEIDEGKEEQRGGLGGEGTNRSTSPAPLPESSVSEDQYMESLLAQLTGLDPPSHPVITSLDSVGTESEGTTTSSEEEDSLTKLRRILLEDTAMKEEEERDTLADLRRQLMEENTNDGNLDEEKCLREEETDELENAIQDIDDFEEEEEEEEDSARERENPEGEEVEEESTKKERDEDLRTDGHDFSELERCLLAFTSGIDQGEKNNDKEVTTFDESLATKVSKNNDMESPEMSSRSTSTDLVDMNSSKSNLLILSDSGGTTDEKISPKGSPTTVDTDTLEKDTKEKVEEKSNLQEQTTPFVNDTVDKFEMTKKHIDLTGYEKATEITIIPPTPTVQPSQNFPVSQIDSTDILTHISNPVLPQNTSTSEIKKENKRSSGQSTPQFSPVVSLRNSPETTRKETQNNEKKIEKDSKKCAAQIVIALEHLHANGIICRDLHPGNVLLTQSGDVALTYFGKWDYVPLPLKNEVVERLYVAPELLGLEIATPAADWWSLGAIMFELLTGKLLVDCHPGGVHSHIPLTIPAPISPEAKSLLEELLQVNPLERLGSGLNGIEDIKSHPFFFSVDWNTLCNNSTTK